MQKEKDLGSRVLYFPSIEAGRRTDLSEGRGWLYLALAFGLLLNFVFPGDTPWIHDEPLLLLKAFDHNTHGRMALEGLRSGATGITYGPTAVWFYQGLLLLTRNPVQIVLMKTVLSAGTLTAFLLFLSVRLRLSRWPILLCLLSPYLYLSYRALWDNVLLVPLSLLAVCFALLFHEDRKASYWGAWLLLALFMIHLHLMSAILIVPVGAVLVCRHLNWFLRRPGWCMVSFLSLAGSLLPYLDLTGKGTMTPWAADPGSFAGPEWNTWGPYLFSFLGFLPYFVPSVLEEGLILSKPLVSGLVVVSSTVLLPFIIGLGGCLWETRRLLDASTWSSREFLSVCAILVVVSYGLLFYLTGLRHHPHYDHGVWFAFFYPVWRGWQWFFQWLGRAARVFLGLQIGATGVLLWALIVFIHLSGGTQGIHFGPTLSNQISAVETVLKYSPKSPIMNGVEHYDLFPQAFSALVRLLGDPEPTGEKPLRSLTLQQVNDPRWFWIQVIIDPPTSPSGGREERLDGALS
jgi:hypothetical protein